MQQPVAFAYLGEPGIKSGLRRGVICLKRSNKPEIDEVSSLGDFPSGEVVKNLPANAEDARDVVGSLGHEDPLEEEIATCSSSLGWKIP